ncbi:DUF4179 domain-containing protein [Metabacillus sp. FJAT-52054]|uniref:DUF4179 domain-containing protein n=1 Tax=Metabacillus sediminis TaxID=3117746 RepID=A0ABZ2NJ64_9BACI
MKNDFEKDLGQIMNKEKEIPVTVRQAFDQSYESIRAKTKKKKVQFIWKRAAAAACALIATGVVLSNEHVMAGINGFLHFGDKGIEQAVNNGFTQEDHSTAADQNITITLDRHFSDHNKIGLYFKLSFEDASILKNVKAVSMDYRLKNGDGEYIDENIPDTKPLKGNNQYLSSSEHQNSLQDVKSGNIQYEVLATSNDGMLPDLKGAVVEVESVNVFYDKEKLKKINGSWDLQVTEKNKETSGKTVQYVMKDAVSNILVSKAEANPTSLNLIFSLNKVYEDENVIADHIKVIDEDGDEFASDGSFSMDRKKNKTIIYANLPFTSYNDSSKLTLVIEGIGEVELVKK